MRLAAKIRAGRTALVAAGALTIMAASGCSYINPQSTMQQYSASDGVHGEVGSIELRNILLVSEGGDKPARIVGAVFNNASTSKTVTFAGADGSEATVKVPADGEQLFDLDHRPVILDSTGAMPGALVQIQVSTGSKQDELKVPVLDGTLKHYRDYLPTSAPTP